MQKLYTALTDDEASDVGEAISMPVHRKRSTSRRVQTPEEKEPIVKDDEEPIIKDDSEADEEAGKDDEDENEDDEDEELGEDECVVAVI